MCVRGVPAGFVFPVQQAVRHDNPEVRAAECEHVYVVFINPQVLKPGALFHLLQFQTGDEHEGREYTTVRHSFPHPYSTRPASFALIGYQRLHSGLIGR